MKQLAWITVLLLELALAGSSVAQAGNLQLVNYEAFKKEEGGTRTLYHSTRPITGVRLGNETRPRTWWRTYSGQVIVSVEQQTAEGRAYNTEINLWFPDRDDAEAFVRLLDNTAEARDLYYDFYNNPLNSVTTQEDCKPLVPFSCRNNEYTIVNSYNMDFGSLYIFDPATGQMKRAKELL